MTYVINNGSTKGYITFMKALLHIIFTGLLIFNNASGLIANPCANKSNDSSYKRGSEKVLNDSSIVHNSFRIELGLGPGIAGEGGGLSGRLALSYVGNNWGIVARTSAFDGAKGACSNCWFGPPVEKFYDKAILLSRVISKIDKYKIKSVQTISSLGIGMMHGEKLTPLRNDLEDVGNTLGLAFEIGVLSTGSTVGYGISLMGNLNKESNIFGFIFLLTLGYQK